jgi:hypothetical protein
MRVSLVRSTVAIAGLLTCWSPFVQVAAAQRNQPVYPAYDGYIQNADGSYTLAFAYFSHNAEPVTIAPGTDNAFGPGPADRMQPITFQPGHNRFQCVMVVGPEFDGALRWTLTYAGTTTSTSEHMLQSNWYLVEGAGELGKIDHAKAPRGVCLNRAPNVRVLGLRAGRGGAPPVLKTTQSEVLNLFGSVRDEGLPRSGTLKAGWKQVSGPAPVNFERADRPRTRARFTAAGSYQLELVASDGELSSSMRIIVEVAGGAN